MSPRIVVALLLVSVWVHFPSYPADFSFDDQDFVQENASIRSLSGVLSSFASPFPPQDQGRGLYRPVTALSYAIDFKLYTLNAWGYHFSNFLIYAIAVLLVARLAYLYRPSLVFSLAVGLIFSLHPVHCEAVDSISGRSEMLALVFCVASLIAFLHVLKKLASIDAPTFGQADPSAQRSLVVLLGISVAWYALACLSKETGVVLPGILAVHVLVYFPNGSREKGLRNWRTGVLLLSPFALVLAGYLILRIYAIGHFEPSAPILGDASVWSRVHTAGAVFARYLQLLVFPNTLQVDYYYQQSVGVRQGGSLDSLFGLSMLAALFGVFVWQLRRVVTLQTRALDPDMPNAIGPAQLLVISLALFIAFMLPVSHIVDIGALMAERFLFLPSIAFALVVAMAGSAVADRLGTSHNGIIKGLCFGLLLICGIAGMRSSLRAAEWRDGVLLWESAARVIDSDPRVHANLGQAYFEHERLEDAESELERALAIDPEHREALGNLARIQGETEHYAAASDTYRRILKLNPEDAMTWNNLGVIEVRRSRYQAALRYFSKALEYNPNLALAQGNLRRGREAILKQRSPEAPERNRVARRAREPGSAPSPR